MEQISYIHKVLQKRSKEANWPYMSSIILKNENVPLFEEYFGMLDYSWLLEVTKSRICVEIPSRVIRFVNGNNLSLTPEYRKKDFYMSLLIVDGDIKTMKRMYGTYARYHYVTGKMKLARYYFKHSTFDWKTIMYYISSYFPLLSNFIIKKYGVFG